MKNDLPLTVLEVVHLFLKYGKYDGLYDPGECACKKEDLAPCGQIGHTCRVGYLQEGNTGTQAFMENGFRIGPHKPKPKPRDQKDWVDDPLHLDDAGVPRND